MSAFQAGETCSDASCGWMSAYHDCNYSRDGASRFRVGAPLRESGIKLLIGEGGQGPVYPSISEGTLSNVATFEAPHCLST